MSDDTWEQWCAWKQALVRDDDDPVTRARLQLYMTWCAIRGTDALQPDLDADAFLQYLVGWGYPILLAEHYVQTIQERLERL